ncbi:hypothetical protein FJZ21_01290 [Candidatus Pacearchaeota archaeon]|nr:hypothetical protein [Candidatus Pacearchaeota archaeon]
MRNLNKKGMSSVVQISLLTILSVTAISMVWGYVSDFSNSLNQLSPAVDCISQKSKLTSACVNSEGKVKLNIDVGLEEYIYNLNINYLEESFFCGQTCGSCSVIDEQGRKVIYINTQENVNLQDTITVSINKCLEETATISQC